MLKAVKLYFNTFTVGAKFDRPFRKLTFKVFTQIIIVFTSV